MKQLIPLAVLLVLTLPAGSQTLNKAAHIAALIHTEREPRSFKRFFWLAPGREKVFHYDWILEDGSHATQVLDHKLSQVPDLRPALESHPNTARMVPALLNGAFNALGNFLGNKI